MMETKIIYSIIIPVYNAERYLHECISSIVSQISADDEIIIVDDGSIDRSKEVYMAFAQAHSQIKVIQQENQGVYVARQNGISHATGDYVMFVDADDTWAENTLSEVDRLLNQSAADMIIFNYRRVFEGGAVEVKRPACMSETLFEKCNFSDFFIKIVISGAYSSLCTKAIRRTCFSDLRSISENRIKVGEDLLQSLLIINNIQRVFYTPNILYNYRVNTQSASFQYDLSRLEDLLTVHSFFYELISKSFPDNMAVRKAYWHSFFSTIHYNSITFWGAAKIKEIAQWNAKIHDSEVFSIGVEEQGDKSLKCLHRLTIIMIKNRVSVLSKGLGETSKWKRKLKS